MVWVGHATYGETDECAAVHEPRMAMMTITTDDNCSSSVVITGIAEGGAER